MAENRGGPRPGAGRKPLVDEMRIQKMAVSAVEKIYGSVEAGLESLLLSNSDTLRRFAWEHAVGRPREKVELSTDPENPPQIIIQPIQTVAAPIQEKETDEEQQTSL